MINIDLLYRLEQFYPPDKNRDLGGYNFAVRLNKSFALRAMNKKMSHSVYERFQEIGERLVVRRLFSHEYLRAPFDFFEGSFLAQTFHVPGDACTLGFDHLEAEDLIREKLIGNRNYVEYTPHNLDSMKQAYALLSLFHCWVDFTEANLSS